MIKRQIILFTLTILMTNVWGQQNDKENTSMVVASAKKMNIVFLGLANPIDIAVSGISSNDIKVLVDNGKITGENGHYFLIPDKLGNTTISVFHTDKLIGKCYFRVKQLDAPLHVTIADKKGGEISKKELISAGFLKAYFHPSDFDLKARVVAFRIITVKDGYVKDLKKTGDRLNNDMIELIESLESGSPLFIEGIKVESADGVIQDFDPLSFKIID